uniref:Uncharacterized protein n=1 Tax=Molossus molossus TaxID=27622 RepID=A0A7J8DNJ0_MOLMO|nr:hypothetical protein HJG59_001646 [Molossus molossus]
MTRGPENDWETEKPRPREPWAPDEKAAERTLGKNGIPARALDTGDRCKDRGFRWQGERCVVPLLGMWTKRYASDPRVALGKYSPLEKEILRLGGVHTVASRRFLSDKQEQERKMLKELQSRSLDHKQALVCKKQPPPICPTCGTLEKVWRANVTTSPEALAMPRRERLTVGKHVGRMRSARAWRDDQLLPFIQRGRDSSVLSGAGPGPAARDNTREDEGEDDDDDSDDAAPKKREKSLTKRQEIKMNVIFKSKEPRTHLTHQPNDLKPFFPTKKGERSITGSTNRNLFRVAEFPGDLMLMSQDLVSRGVCPGDVRSARCLREVSVWNGSMGKPASRRH